MTSQPKMHDRPNPPLGPTRAFGPDGAQQPARPASPSWPSSRAILFSWPHGPTVNRPTQHGHKLSSARRPPTQPAQHRRPHAHKPLTSRTRPSAVTHRTPPHQDKLTNRTPRVSHPSNRIIFLPTPTSSSTRGRPAWQVQARGSRTSHDPISPCAVPTPPHAGRRMRRTHHHRSIAIRHWSP